VSIPHKWMRTNGTTWYPFCWECEQCDTLLWGREWKPPDEVAKIAEVDPDCEVQMVKNVMRE